jgi:hypothetical protein
MLYTDRKIANPKNRNHKDFQCLRTCCLLPPPVSAYWFALPWAKYKILPIWVWNCTLTSCIAYKASVIGVWALRNHLQSALSPCWKMDMALFHMLLWCSVSNGFKFPVWFRVLFRPGTGPLQWVSTRNPAFQVNDFGSNEVSELWLYRDMIST